MILRSKLNNAIVIVDSSFAERLLDGGSWEVTNPAPEKPAETNPPRRQRRRTAPVEEQTPQE